MKGNRAVLTAVVVVVLVVAGLVAVQRDERGRADRPAREQFDWAARRSARAGSVHRSSTRRSNGETKKAIASTGVRHPHHLEGPGARRRVARRRGGLKPEAWDKEGNGVSSAPASPTAARSSSSSRSTSIRSPTRPIAAGFR